MPLKTFRQMLDDCAATSSKKEKEQILRDRLRGESRQLIQLALSPYIRFGIAKLPKPNPHAEPYTSAEQAYSETVGLLKMLADRTVTGNAAIFAVATHLGALDEEDRETFGRILLKDLRAGFDVTTVNKAVPGLVPVFSCQLAPSAMPEVDEIKYPVFVEPKYDGVRTIAIKRNSTVTLFSRNGLPHENFEEIRSLLEASMPDNFVLDGEIISPNGFADLMTRAKAKQGKATHVPVCYAVFDGMSTEYWDRQSCPIPLVTRRIMLFDIVDWCQEIFLAPQYLASSAEKLNGIFEFLIEQGFEGAMVKERDGLYTFKRNATWQKLKPFETADLRVVDLVVGTGKYSDRLGALVCEGEHAGKFVRTEVGSGFTDQQRLDIWMKREVIGRVAEIRYQEFSKSEDNDHYSLRFPTFVRFRPEDGLGKL